MAMVIAVAAIETTILGAEPAHSSRIPVLLDTDIGGDIDDALALGLLLSSPEVDLRGITTVHGDAHTRALLICRLLHAVGRTDIPVAAGAGPRAVPDYHGQLQYGLRPCFRKRPRPEGAVEFLYRQFKANPGRLTLLAIGPLTNVAALLDRHLDAKPWIKRIVLMGGALHVGYQGKPPAEAEWNVQTDVKAAQKVFASGVPLVVAPLDATVNLKLKRALRERLLQHGTPLTWQLHALYQLWDQSTPTLFDPLAAALCFEEKFCTMGALRLEVDGKGITRIARGKPNVRVAVSVREADFLQWFANRLAPSKPAAPDPVRRPVNVSALVARGRMPYRVHVAEDYESDIERRWWMCGRLEEKNVPPGSKRACRGVLTGNFDDLQGDPRAMYTAVIFNPVPGPPMGKHTRLAFRYWLRGSTRLRVQIYSLTRGYHRCLTLTGLPQGRWQEAAVDMTAARRPDGGGGPLAADERIDDIQFYADPAAQLLINDIVLYDAALPAEKRPFPRRVLFTGWFDTGRQGHEWPGDFAIVNHDKPITWKAAQSVLDPKSAAPWIRLSLRGPRTMGRATRLAFRYWLTGADKARVLLVNRSLKDTHQMDVVRLRQDRWAEMDLDITHDSRRGSGRAGKPRSGDQVDEIQFRLPRGAMLRVDDVLLYEPGEMPK
jgi:inosine-uridine nucleoside N-ribohydrolase